MAFTDRQKINMFTKALVAGVIDSESMAAWYESFFPFTFIMDSAQVWLQIDLLKENPASNINVARSNATGNLAGVVQDLSQNADAVRLTQMTGSNGTTWVAYSVYGDTTSAVLQNWLLPQLVPQSSGAPSVGYGVLLYNGDPNNGGTLISTTTGASGSGETASQSWVFNYANGLLFLSPDFTGTVNDPYLLGFRYVGTTVKDLGGTNQDLADLQSSLNTLSARVDTNENSITSNATDIATNTNSIDSNTTSIQTNATNITNNETSIQTNTGNISTNSANIQVNADNISALQGDVATINNNMTDLGDRVTDVEVKLGTSGLVAKFVKR